MHHPLMSSCRLRSEVARDHDSITFPMATSADPKNDASRADPDARWAAGLDIWPHDRSKVLIDTVQSSLCEHVAGGSMTPTAFVTHVSFKGLRDRVSVARSSQCQRAVARDRLAVPVDRSRVTASIEAEEGSASKSLASVVFKYFDRWNSRKIESILPIFAPQVHYEDALYPKPLQNREALYQHLTKAARVLPQYLIFVIDDVCEDPERGRCAVRFHLEDKRSGTRVPFSRGTSFFTAMRAPETPDGWLITSGWDVPEPFLKAGNILLGIAGFAATISSLVRGKSKRY